MVRRALMSTGIQYMELKGVERELKDELLDQL